MVPNELKRGTQQVKNGAQGSAVFLPGYLDLSFSWKQFPF